MQDPKRWSELASGASTEESELLLAGASERMPSELRGQVWSAVTLAAAGGAAATALGGASAAAQNGVATVETASTAGAVSKGLALASSSVIKGVIAIAVLGGAGVEAMHLRSSASTRASAQHSPAVHGAAARAAASSMPPELAHGAAVLEMNDGTPSAVASAPTAATNAAETSATPAAPSKAQSALPARRVDADAAAAPASDASAASLVSSRLREESAAVLAIRRTLLAGNAREALTLLARARAEFPHGALAEEREALSVRALMAAGDRDAARLRGEAFLRRFPRSPQAGEVRRLLGSE